MLCLSIFNISIHAKYYPDNKDNIYVHKQTEKKTVALTFDDGPHPIKTRKVLDVLKKHDVKATFFIIGENAQKNPEIVQEIAAMGHEIGNHTFDHKSVYKLPEKTLVESVKKCENIIKQITGQKTVLFRPPEGFMNDGIASAMQKQGYDVILWRVDTYDWKGRSAIDIYKTVTQNVKCGDIILMHDYIWRKSNTAEALDLIIDELKKQGYEFVTISKMFDI